MCCTSNVNPHSRQREHETGNEAGNAAGGYVALQLGGEQGSHPQLARGKAAGRLTGNPFPLRGKVRMGA